MYLRSACRGSNCTVPDCTHSKSSKAKGIHLKNSEQDDVDDDSFDHSKVILSSSTSIFEQFEQVDLDRECSIELTRFDPVRSSSVSNTQKTIRTSDHVLQVNKQNSVMARTYSNVSTPLIGGQYTRDSVSCHSTYSNASTPVIGGQYTRNSVSSHSTSSMGVKRIATRSSSQFSAKSQSTSSENLSKNSSISRSRSSSKANHRSQRSSQQPWEIEEISAGEEEEEQSLENYLHQTNIHSETKFWQYLKGIRTYPYFFLSKPLHCDIEYLSRIGAFGKKKILFLLFLSLLLFLLCSGAFNNIQPLETFQNVSHQKSSFFYSSSGMLSHLMPYSFFNSVLSSVKLLLKWPFAISNMLCSFSSSLWSEKPKDQLLVQNVNVTPLIKDSVYSDHQSLTKEEIEVLIRQIVEQHHMENRHALDVELVNEEVLKIKSEVSSIRPKLNVLTANLEEMQLSSHDKYAMLDKEQKHLFDRIKQSDQHFNEKFSVLEKGFILLNETVHSYRNCCTNSSETFPSLDAILEMVLLSIMEDSKENVRVQAFHTWMSTNFADQNKFLQKISAMQNELKSFKEGLRSDLLLALSQKTSDLKQEILSSTAVERTTSGGMSHQDVVKVVNSALQTYDADKTNEADFALESGGGSVVNTRCSETYYDKTSVLSFLGLPVWYVSNTPRFAIQPDVHPGQCWAFKGSQGYLVIQLSSVVRPTSFVVEHIPKSLSRTGDIESAPNHFSVWGLTSDKDNEGKLLGRYKYDIEKEPLQYFPVTEENSDYFSYVELKIHSNHGNLNYTCLYRFRVHGMRWKNW